MRDIIPLQGWTGARQASARGTRRILLLLLALTSTLTACGFNKPDLHYRDSRLQDPLQVPADLAAPRYSPSMEIPPAGASAAPEAAPTPDGLEIEQPPDLRTDGPDAGPDAGQE